jgi:hypothetical protein
MRFRTRPVEFQAFRWQGQSEESFPQWFRREYRPKDLTISRDRALLGFQAGELLMVVEHGSWICLSEDGQFYHVTDEFMRRVADPIEAPHDKKID